MVKIWVCSEGKYQSETLIREISDEDAEAKLGLPESALSGPQKRRPQFGLAEDAEAWVQQGRHVVAEFIPNDQCAGLQPQYYVLGLSSEEVQEKLGIDHSA